MADTKKFRQAIKDSDLEVLKAITATRFDVNTRYQHDWTGLHFAAKAKQVGIVRLLIAGIEVNAVSEIWQTPLDVARQHGNDSVLDALTKAGGKSATDMWVHAAVFAGDAAKVKKHLASGADVNALVRGELPLCIALERRRWPMADHLLKAGADVNRAQADKDTALHCAARSGADGKTIKKIIKAGADVNARGRWNWRPLSVAADAGELEIATLLIASGAKANSEAAGAALEQGHDDLTRMLIDEGAKVSLCQAVKCGHIPVVRRMIQQGVDLNASDEDSSRFPLILAIENDRSEIAEMLLAAGADPNAQTSVHHGRDYVYGGDTPLHEAVSSGSAKLVKLLLNYGADPDIQDAGNETPLETAKRRGRGHLVDVMEKHLESKITRSAVEKLLTVAAVASLLSVDEPFVQGLIRQGKLSQLKLDPVTLRIPESSVARYLPNLRKGA
jgi:ankyrin repeat protein